MGSDRVSSAVKHTCVLKRVVCIQQVEYELARGLPSPSQSSSLNSCWSPGFYQGSFKIRGIGLTMQEAVKDGARQFVGSSGGNAGMAMAVAAKQLGKKLTIFIPRSTKAFVVKRLEAEGAEVVVGGENWDAANEEAVKAAQEENTFLVHPFDQATTW